MKIFSKAIKEEIWREHLKYYSYSLYGYSSEIKRFLPEKYKNESYNSIYLCPLCLKNFFVNTLHGIEGNAEFSLDHLPPDSVGGKFKVLTCKKCNNDSGIFESELEKLLNFGEDKHDSSAILVKNVRIRDGETGNYLKAMLRNRNNVNDIMFNENAKKYNQVYIDFIKKLHAGKLNKLEIELSVYDKNKIEKALLKSAYLICFVWWGYEFPFSENARRIREILFGNEKYPIKVPASWDTIKDSQKGISLLSIEDTRIAFNVGIELKGRTNSTTANVLIPSPAIDGWKRLEQLGILINNKDKIKLNGLTLPRIQHHMAYTISWNIEFPSKNLTK